MFFFKAIVFGLNYTLYYQSMTEVSQVNTSYANPSTPRAHTDTRAAWSLVLGNNGSDMRHLLGSNCTLRNYDI